MLRIDAATPLSLLLCRASSEDLAGQSASSLGFARVRLYYSRGLTVEI